MPSSLLENYVLVSSCQRRITNGSSVDPRADTSFVVYIIRNKNDPPGWLCGGSIIHPSIVLTSGACLATGGKFMYVISGYRKYITSDVIETNECTKHTRKRITSYCLHKDYGTLSGKNDDEKKFKWLKYDIAIARTNTPIDFFDSNYLKYCSYLPNSINVNYNSRYEESPASVVVYGWGHATYYRPEGDVKDYNERELRYASSIVMPRTDCEDYFELEYLKDRVGNTFICASGDKGEFDSRGRSLVHAKPTREMCDYSRRTGDSKGINRTNCVQDGDSNETESKNDKLGPINVGTTRRNGICQNDHGSPLVLWVGGHAYVVGVASGFHVNKKMECVGPYLYTSVSCTSLFIHCILREQTTLKSRRTPSYCDQSDTKRGFKMEETEIDWSGEEF